jgi:lysophospholipase L1-like esterase
MAVDVVARIVLSPLLIAQAVFVRKKAMKLPEPRGARTGVLGDGPALKLLIVGDSSAAGVGVETQQEALSGQVTLRLAGTYCVDWRLVAKTGVTTLDTIRHLQNQNDPSYNVIVVALGVNDVTRFLPLVLWRKQVERLTNLLRVQFGAQHICFSGVPPMGGFPLLPNPLRWVLGRHSVRLDQGLRGFIATQSDCSYVALDLPLDQSAMAVDGFHPGAQVYAAWADRISTTITERQNKAHLQRSEAIVSQVR